MSLTWKDLITTSLAGITIWFSYLVLIGYKFPIIVGYRWATLILLILGVGMCAFSSASGASGMFITIASGLGVLALILVVLGLIFGTKFLFISLLTVIIALWIVSTLRHLIGS